MKTRTLFNLAIAGVVAALGMAPGPVHAQWLSYAAKFVCGVQDGVPTEQPVVNGKYRTVVNIHNPHYLGAAAPAPVVFFKKAVLALPQGEDPVPPTCKLVEFLDADHALGVDCANIRQLFNLSGIAVPVPFDGFLVIEVPPQANLNEGPELDVTAVYTARHRPGMGADAADYDVQAVAVERIDPKRVIGNPNDDQCPPD